MDLRFNVIPLDLNPSHYDAQGSYIFRKRRFSSLMHLPYVHAAATTPVQQLGVFLARLTPPYQPSPIPLSGRPAHRPFRDPMTCCGWRLIPHQSGSLPSILELTMKLVDKSEPLTAIHTQLGAIFISL